MEVFMNYSSDYINKIIDEEIIFSNNLANKYHYPDNITHLLYIIVPAFILKYGNSYRSIVEKCFATVPIIISDKQDKIYQAYYFSRPVRYNNDIIIEKGIVLKNYKDIGLMQLIDNLVHEFNHAINSMQNEMLIDSHVKLRTGLVYNYFNINDLSFIKQGPEVTIEEVINTRQTELIIDIIHSFSNYDIKNTTVLSTLYSINHSINNNYHSNSYFLESYVCQRLLNNKTFISTLENLRFVGQIDDINTFFNSITGDDNSFLMLANYLNKSLKLQKDYAKAKWFKKNILRKIKDNNQLCLKIIDKFDNNTIYK